MYLSGDVVATLSVTSKNALVVPRVVQANSSIIEEELAVGGKWRLVEVAVK